MKVLVKPIEMISWTEKDGKIHPVRFKISDESDASHVYRIKKIYTTELEKLAGNKTYRFTCEVVMNNLVKVCEIRYELDSCRWTLFKI